LRTRGRVCLVIIYCLLVACGHRTSPRPASAPIPGEVGLIDAEAYPDRIVLRWGTPVSNTDGSALTDISGFKVYRTATMVGEECEDCDDRKLHSNVDYEHPVNALIKDGEVVYTDKRVDLGHTYRYRISAYSLKGREGPTSEDVEVILDKPPPSPGELQAKIDSRGVVLEWAAPEPLGGILGYRVYRGESDKTEKMKSVGRTRWAETTFVDKGVEKNKSYYYAVRSLKMNRGVILESRPSGVVRASVPAVTWDPPESVNATVTATGIRIYWDPVKTGTSEARYNIYRQESDNMFEKLNEEPLQDPWFHDSKVVSGRTYRYTVTAFPKGRPEDESTRSASEAKEFTP